MLPAPSFTRFDSRLFKLLKRRGLSALLLIPRGQKQAFRAYAREYGLSRGRVFGSRHEFKGYFGQRLGVRVWNAGLLGSFEFKLRCERSVGDRKVLRSHDCPVSSLAVGELERGRLVDHPDNLSPHPLDLFERKPAHYRLEPPNWLKWAFE